MIHVWRRLNPDTCVLFDDETLALLEVDNLTARLLLSGDLGQAEQPVSGEETECLQTIRTLCEKGIIRLERDTAPQIPVEPQLEYLLLNVSHACDMNCVYCFGQGGSYGGPNELMSEEVARRAIDLLAASPSNRPKRIALFGGEPLVNPGVVKFILTYGRQVIGDKSQLGFSISTNGTMLTPEMTDLLTKHDVTIQISIDGTRELQNRLRPLRTSGDSFDVVFAAVQDSLRINPNLHARATVTNLCFNAMDLAAQLFSLGFKTISLQPVHGCGALELTDEQIRELGEGYRLLARRGLGHKVSWLDSLLRRIRVRAKTEQFCGAGFKGLAVVPNGKLYLCHRLVPLAEFEVGDVWSGVNKEKLRALLRGMERVECSLVCASCVYRHLCGGGCMAENFFDTGSLRDPSPSRCLLSRIVCGTALETYIDEFYRVNMNNRNSNSVEEDGICQSTKGGTDRVDTQNLAS
ncbi:MAG TPA: SPASM domain-containing protein [Firmicutes bacterium]|nr:SPASM domain-containing protein [Candidatus Fermentithermobacillaceae bacterium]